MARETENRKRKVDIGEAYRRILKMPNLTKKDIDEMRKYLGLLVQTICEHLWGKKLY